MVKKTNARSIAAKKMWANRKRKLKKTTAKTTPATKEEAGATRQAIGAEQALVFDYRAMYERADDQALNLSRSLQGEQRIRSSLDRDLDTIAKLVAMLKVS